MVDLSVQKVLLTLNMDNKLKGSLRLALSTTLGIGIFQK